MTRLDGSVEAIDPTRLSQFVTEAGNPGNGRQVAVVDLLTPAMIDLPRLRLVDTPGLGSVLAHNTEATRAWMPHAAAALVTVSAERPLSEEDRRLVAEARQVAPRVVVVLTKVDLLTDLEREEVVAFLNRALRDCFAEAVPVLPFSSRVEPGRWVGRLREFVLLPITENVTGEQRAALALKRTGLAVACRSYLAVGLQSAERADADRDRLRAAVLDESVNAVVIHDELHLAEQAVRAGTRQAFGKTFLAQQSAVRRRLTGALASELTLWRGNLARQLERYEAWMAEQLTTELTPLSRDAAPLAAHLLSQAETRLRRIVGAFQDRLGRNVRETVNVALAPAAWELRRPTTPAAPIAVSRALMTNWELLWWMLPMGLVGALFRRHVLGLVAWEVEKNLTRLAADWSATVDAAMADLRTQAAAQVDAELITLDRLLGRRNCEAGVFRAALRRLEETSRPQTA